MLNRSPFARQTCAFTHLTRAFLYNARAPCMSNSKHRHRVKPCNLRFIYVDQRNRMELRVSKGHGDGTLLDHGQMARVVYKNV